MARQVLLLCVWIAAAVVVLGTQKKGGNNGGQTTCDNSCPWPDDGVCDDGGEGAEYRVCDFGADCNDCGDRSGPNGDCRNHCGPNGNGWVGDGECDDGGVGASYMECEFGTDCADCGIRPHGVCERFCEWDGDGFCDDGGLGAAFSPCKYGSDCTDCGPRQPGKCLETCQYHNDGECDDGGPGAEYIDCEYGTDCMDCGHRDFYSSMCRDACVTKVGHRWVSLAQNGICEDGGEGSSTDDCIYGYDCSDCGYRDALDDPINSKKSLNLKKKSLLEKTKSGLHSKSKRDKVDRLVEILRKAMHIDKNKH